MVRRSLPLVLASFVTLGCGDPPPAPVDAASLEDAGASDDFQAGGGLHDGAGDLGFGTHHEGDRVNADHITVTGTAADNSAAKPMSLPMSK